MARAFLGLGSNVDPEENVAAALHRLCTHPQVTLTGISTLYWTPPLAPPGREDEDRGTGQAPHPDFLNGVLEITTQLSPAELEEELHAIEEALGRVRTTDRYAPRPMDLDLLVYLPPGGEHAPPPPALLPRPWVALPLQELAPDLRFVHADLSIQEVAGAFSDPGGTPALGLTRGLRARFLP